jgi:dTDP-4-dehydrorhamnose reductase
VKILITGSSGQLGETFKRISSKHTYNFIFTNRSVLDITNKKQVDEYFGNNAFDCIINCAAYTAVDLAEEDEKKAFSVNEAGVENLVKACERNNMAMIHFSTDYVFDGRKNQPYIEEDKTNPLGIYGQSKLAGEQKILASGISALIFRTSWLYAKHGKNFYNTMLRIGAEKDQINVVADQIGTPTNTTDLALSVLQCIQKYELWKGQQEIYHFSNEGVASWYDFAKAIFEYNKLSCKVNPISTQEYPTAAKRPFYSVLNKQKFKDFFKFDIKHWRESL